MEKAAETFASISFLADDAGSITLFGGDLCALPSALWISMVEKLLSSAARTRRVEVEASILEAAGRYCYHLAHEAIESPEFRAAARQAGALEKVDLMRVFLGLLAAWGWGDSEAAFLEPDKKLVVHAHSYFEADIGSTFSSTRPCAFMLSGMCRALMDLMFAAPFPGGFGSFACTQTRGMECGDPYGEFVVTRKDAP